MIWGTKVFRRVFVEEFITHVQVFFCLVCLVAINFVWWGISIRKFPFALISSVVLFSSVPWKMFSKLNALKMTMILDYGVIKCTGYAETCSKSQFETA